MAVSCTWKVWPPLMTNDPSATLENGAVVNAVAVCRMVNTVPYASAPPV